MKALGVVVIVLASGLTLTDLTLGQETQKREERVDVIAADDSPSREDYHITLAQSQFELFSIGDVAIVGMRGQGTMQHNLTNTSPIDYYFNLGAGTVWQTGTPNGTAQIFFEGPLWAGTPASEWYRNRDFVPSLYNVVGGGYNSVWNGVLFGMPLRWQPKDGQLSLVHSGVPATADGECTDFTADRVYEGSPLGAASDCPETWGSDGFAGASRWIALDSWADYFGLAGATDFAWDWWRVPEQFVSSALIGDYQTYHEIVDWGSDRLVRYGNVIPGGMGSPLDEGYPLGLTFKVDAFSFRPPDVANVTFWRAMLINESEQVYGEGLYYDSLYIGQMLEPLFRQSTAFYYRPELGALLLTENGVNPDCNGALIPPGVPSCIYGSSNPGFNLGAAAVIVLNSPIGDLRNKLFSDPTSPFYAPNHSLAGDTITFNHGHICGYGGCFLNTINRNARSGFGIFSSRPIDVLDGRSVWDLSDSHYWRIFRSYDFPNRSGQFNRYVTPEGWRYSNRPWATGPGPDTLFLDSCIGWQFNTIGLDGCVDSWSDTLPGRINNRYGNVSAGIGIGPFPLAAGDTTKYTLAIVTGEGQAEIEANIGHAIDYYLDSYPRVEVAIDIKPGSNPNSINTRSMGVVPVAILGSDEFDVTDVDVTTLAFGPGGAMPAHDLNDPYTYNNHLQDVNYDGYIDLVSHYLQKETGLMPINNVACITGSTNDATRLVGCDEVRVMK
jgi:hypothetical protein